MHQYAGYASAEAALKAGLDVDPSSPYSGGALFVDRIRMSDLAGDPGVSVRSMVTRGALGGPESRLVQALLGNKQ